MVKDIPNSAAKAKSHQLLPNISCIPKAHQTSLNRLKGSLNIERKAVAKLVLQPKMHKTSFHRPTTVLKFAGKAVAK